MSILQIINQKMNGGHCPDKNSLGECCAVSYQRGHSGNRYYIAHLYLWTAAADLKAAEVAKWFRDAGCTWVTVYSALDDAGNDIVDGASTSDGARPWDVHFSAPADLAASWGLTEDDAQSEIDAYREQGQRILAEATEAKNAAYRERNQLVALLSRLYPSGIAQTPIEGWAPEWHGCVYIDLPTGQASWHFHTSEAHLFADLPPYAGSWDGHSTEEKYGRVAALAALSNEQIDALHDSMFPRPLLEEDRVKVRALVRAALAASGARAQALSNDECDKLAARAMDAVAKVRGIHSSDLNHDITAHHMLRRALIRAGAFAAAQAAPAAQAEDAATVAGLQTAAGHLSALVDEAQTLLTELRQYATDLEENTLGGQSERGEVPLLDRVDDWLEARVSRGTQEAAA